MPSSCAFSRAAYSEARAAKRRQSSTLVSTGSPSLDRNSITLATASPKVFSSASSSQASRKRAVIRSNIASIEVSFPSRNDATASAACARMPRRSSHSLATVCSPAGMAYRRWPVSSVTPSSCKCWINARKHGLYAGTMGFVVGAGDDEAWNAHDVELKAGRVQSLVLLVLRHKHFAALMAALLRARTLVFDVITGNAGFHEAADQVAHVWIAAVTGVGVGDDERPKIPSVRCGALRLSHPRTQILLVAIRREQGAHERRCFVGHLAERIAGEIGSRVFARSALGGGRPAAEVDRLDSHPLHRHCLPRRVGAKSGDALALREKFTQAIVKRCGRLTRYRVVVADGAALLDHLTRGIWANDPRESGAVEPLLGLVDFLFERSRKGTPWFRQQNRDFR